MNTNIQKNWLIYDNSGNHLKTLYIFQLRFKKLVTYESVTFGDGTTVT